MSNSSGELGSLSRKNKEAFFESAGAEKYGVFGSPFFESFYKMGSVLIEESVLDEGFEIAFAVRNFYHTFGLRYKSMKIMGNGGADLRICSTFGLFVVVFGGDSDVFVH